MQKEAESVKSKRSPPVVDAHTHVFCWGENPKQGFLSNGHSDFGEDYESRLLSLLNLKNEASGRAAPTERR